MAVTNKHIYFASTKSLKVPHAKIIVIQPYQDGVGIHRDAQSARRQTFVTGDGWFTYQFLANVANLSATQTIAVARRDEHSATSPHFSDCGIRVAHVTLRCCFSSLVKTRKRHMVIPPGGNNWGYVA